MTCLFEYVFKVFYKGLKCLTDPIIQGKTTNNKFV